MEEVARQIPGAHLDEPNRSLRSFAALLNQIDLLICNDTGPFHLACALHRPVIGIYASTDPALCGPHQAPHARVIARRSTCTPCLKRKCRQPFCFLQIGTEEVLAASQTMLSHR
jgi:ADP-heptose:LPS heptosyltransferase